MNLYKIKFSREQILLKSLKADEDIYQSIIAEISYTLSLVKGTFESIGCSLIMLRPEIKLISFYPHHACQNGHSMCYYCYYKKNSVHILNVEKLTCCCIICIFVLLITCLQLHIGGDCKVYQHVATQLTFKTCSFLAKGTVSIKWEHG